MNTEQNNSDHASSSGDHSPSFWERNVNWVIVGLIIACAGTLVAQLVFTPMYDEHHPAHFEQEEWFGFQAMFGFAAFVVVVFLGRFLRVFVKREEGYYDS